MIRVAVSQAAFDAIVAIMKLGSVGYENATDERGERRRPVPHVAVVCGENGDNVIELHRAGT
jgi:hypothetical protein